MSLTLQQRATLAADIISSTDPAVVAARANPRNDTELTRLYNLPSTFIVWRTLVTESEITRNTSAEATTWSWTAYIARSQGERDAWARMFNGVQSVNPSLLNVRNAFADIFSGAPGAAQRTHLQAVCKRPALRTEALFATGTGTTTTPGLLGWEGSITTEDMGKALNEAGVPG